MALPVGVLVSGTGTNLQALLDELHPGVIATKLLRQGFGPVQGKPVEQGARAIAMLAAGPTTEPSGSYFSDGVATPPSSVARDPAIRKALWDATTRLAKV